MNAYCLKYKDINACQSEDIISFKNEPYTQRVLNYVSKHQNKINENYMRSYLNDSVYNILSNNHQHISHTELKDIVELLKVTYNELNEKSNLIFKVRILLVELGYNIDIEQGLIDKDMTVYIFNDGSQKAMSYMKYAIQV